MAEGSGWDPKDPNDVADYWFDWGSDAIDEEDRFLPAEESITTSVLEVPAEADQPVPDPDSGYEILTKVDESNTEKVVRIRVAGGIAPENYPITNTITTVTGQIFEQTKILPVRERIK